MAVSCWFIDIYDSILEPPTEVPTEVPTEPPTEVPAEVPLVLRNTVLFLLLSLSLSPPPYI